MLHNMKAINIPINILIIMKISIAIPTGSNINFAILCDTYNMIMIINIDVKRIS
jgi:hypothetical protein